MHAKVYPQFAAMLVCALVIGSCAPSVSTVKDEGGVTDPVMGDWRGYRVTNTGMVAPVAVQAVALGANKYGFNVQTYFDQRELIKESYEAQFEGGRFAITDHPDWQAKLADGVLSGTTSLKDGQYFYVIHVVRLSPTLGAKAPANAVVLFDGTNLNGWERRDAKQKGMPAAWKVGGGIAEVSPGGGDIVTKQKFSDFQLHLEFRLPFMPEARGQARANSGVYMQGRYEVQVLDSYGLKGEDNECGGIYKVSAPRVNMCAPPGQWQTYDVTFHAPRFDKDRNKIKDAVVTVVHNGILIHKDLVVPGPTGGSIDDDVHLPGGLLLQDHGNLVQYRNVWLVELKD